MDLMFWFYVVVAVAICFISDKMADSMYIMLLLLLWWNKKNKKKR